MLIETLIHSENQSENKISHSVHRIFCIDCSGSMSGSLGDLRTQLKNKISKMIQPDDFFTLIWFSGRGQFGTIFEHLSINDIKDLSSVHQSIDRYIKSVGSTGFVEPIRLCKTLSEKYNETSQVFFMSDGGENSWPLDECEKAFQEMEGIPMVIVEYQYYCDRVFLKRLAELSSGVSIFNEDFESFDETFDIYMKNKVSSLRHLDTTQNVIYFDETNLVVKKPVNGIVKIPDHIDTVWKVDEQPFVFDSQEREKTCSLVKHVYMTMLYALQTKNPLLAGQCCETLGDVYLSRMYASCFSKQDYSKLSQHITQCIFDPVNYAFKNGVDLSYKAKDDAFNIIELLQLVSSDTKSRFYPYKTPVQYNRVSKETNKEKNTFIPNRELGSKFRLVYNQSRANISMGCEIYGHQENEDDEKIISVSAYRNYTVLKDGIKNMNILPFSLSEKTFDKLVEEGCLPPGQSYKRGEIYLVDLSNLPVVNRHFVLSPISSVEFCRHHINLYRHKAFLKYIGSVKKSLEEKEEESEKSVYEREEKEEKKEEKERDFYVAPELQVKISKCSSIPTINQKLFDKLNSSSKLTLSESILLSIHKKYTEECTAMTKDEKRNWLDREEKVQKENVFRITSIVEQAKMALLIGRVWFNDCEDDVHNFRVDNEGTVYEVSVEINDSKIYMD